MNRELTAADMRKVAQAEVAAARENSWYEITWKTIRDREGDTRASEAKRAYLSALMDGGKTTRQIADATGRQVKSTWSRMVRYANEGLVSVDTQPGGSVYTLTGAGLEWLAGELRE